MSYADETHDDSVDLWTVLQSREEINAYDSAVETFRQAAKTFVETVARINPSFVELYEHATRASTATIEGAQDDFLERLDDLMADWVDHDMLDATRETADIDEDDLR